MPKLDGYSAEINIQLGSERGIRETPLRYFAQRRIVAGHIREPLCLLLGEAAHGGLGLRGREDMNAGWEGRVPEGVVTAMAGVNQIPHGTAADAGR
jgi:hypothetical protein